MSNQATQDLDLALIRKICRRYANGGIFISQLSKEFGLSKEKIRKIFATAIVLEYVDQNVATKMKATAIQNNQWLAKHGIKPNNKIELYYDSLIERSLIRKRLFSKISYISHILSVYDDTFSYDTDYPYTKEELQSELERCKKELKFIEKV